MILSEKTTFRVISRKSDNLQAWNWFHTLELKWYVIPWNCFRAWIFCECEFTDPSLFSTYLLHRKLLVNSLPRTLTHKIFHTLALPLYSLILVSLWAQRSVKTFASKCINCGCFWKGLTFVTFSVVWDSERLQPSKTYRYFGKADAKVDQIRAVAQSHFEKDRGPGATRYP